MKTYIVWNIHAPDVSKNERIWFADGPPGGYAVLAEPFGRKELWERTEFADPKAALVINNEAYRFHSYL